MASHRGRETLGHGAVAPQPRSRRARARRSFPDRGRSSGIHRRTCAVAEHVDLSLGVPPTAWRFLVDANGKPSIDPNVGPHQVQFNLSHTRGLVAVALASRGVIGVDVEEIDEAKANLAIAEAYFARSEVEMLQKAPPSERARCFFRLWTLKEAYIKAIGKGLSAPLNSFAFTFEPIRIAFLPGQADDASNWRFQPYQPQTVTFFRSQRIGRIARRWT